MTKEEVPLNRSNKHFCLSFNTERMRMALVLQFSVFAGLMFFLPVSPGML